MILGNEKSLKWRKWREKYGALVVAVSCLCSLISSWGNNWIITSILGVGVFVCGTIGIFDIKRSMMEKD